MRKEIMGVTFDDVTLEEAVAAGEALAAGPGFSYVVTPNPEIVAMARQTETYREILNGAGLVLPDGIGVVHAAKILGTPLKGRVPGIDFASALVERLARSGLRLFLLGAKPGVAEQAAGKPEKAVPGPCCSAAPMTDTSRTDGPVVEARSGPPGRTWSLSAWGRPSRSGGWPSTAPETGAHLLVGLGGALDVYAGAGGTGAGNLAEAGAGVVSTACSISPAGSGRMAKLPLFLLEAAREKGKRGKP